MNASIERSYLWQHIKVVYVRQNMRIANIRQNNNGKIDKLKEYEQFLLQVGDGTMLIESG